MKKAKLTNFTHDADGYSLYIGSSRLRFASKKKLDRFLRDTERFLTRTTIALNDLFVRLFAWYRDLFFYSAKRSRIYNDLNSLRSDFASVEHSLDLAITRSDFANGNVFAFRHLIAAGRTLKAIAEVLREFVTRKSITVQIYQISGVIDQLDRALIAVGSYGCTEPIQLKKAI